MENLDLDELFTLLEYNKHANILFAKKEEDFYKVFKIKDITLDETVFFKPYNKTVIKSKEYGRVLKKLETLMLLDDYYETPLSQEFFKREALRRAKDLPWEKSVIIYLEDDMHE